MTDASAVSASLPQDLPTSPTSMLLPFLRMLKISGVSLSVIGGNGQREVIAVSDEVAGRIEELQFELGEGPGYEVVATGEAQQVRPRDAPSVHSPFFDGAVQELGVSTIISLPIMSGAIVVGVATLYREEPGLLSPADMATATVLVQWVAGPVVERAVLSANQESTVGARQGKLRREVHQATGMIIAQLDTTASDAFLRLRAYAYGRGETVEDVSRRVITRELDFADLPAETGTDGDADV